jgi:transposase
MTRFPTAGHLSSWAGMAPGNNITGGKRRSGTTTNGDVWPADILNQCARSAARSRDTYLSAQFWRVSPTDRQKKAAVAVGHSILCICWHLLTDNADYDELGGDYFARRGNTARHQETDSWNNSKTSATKSPSRRSLREHPAASSRLILFTGRWRSDLECG